MSSRSQLRQACETILQTRPLPPPPGLGLEALWQKSDTFIAKLAKNLSRQAGNKHDQNLMISDLSEPDQVTDEQLANLWYGDLPEIDDILPPNFRPEILPPKKRFTRALKENKNPNR